MINILLSTNKFGGAWAKPMISEYIKPYHKVLIVPFAFNEESVKCTEDWNQLYAPNCGIYYEDNVQSFKELGIQEEQIQWINYFKDSKDQIKNNIEESDVVFFTGGLPDQAVHRVNEKGFLDLLKDKVIIGVSAGALIQLNHYFLSPDKDYPEFLYCEGLGLTEPSFMIEVHYENSDIQNDCIQKALNDKTDLVYAIAEHGGIIVNSHEMTLFGDVVTFRK